MKRMFGTLVASVSVALACIFALTGCSFFQAKEKTFEKAGMRITLTSDFVEKEIVSQTVYYESRKVIVTALKEEFSMLAGLENYSLEEYTDLTISGTRLSAQAEQREGKDYLYFSYEKNVSGNQFFYLATTHKMSDAFWLIQFACFLGEKEKYTETFLSWADTITEAQPSADGSGDIV